MSGADSSPQAPPRSARETCSSPAASKEGLCTSVRWQSRVPIYASILNEIGSLIASGTLCGLLMSGTVLLYGILLLIPQRLAELGVRAPLWVALLGISMSVAMSFAGLVYAVTVVRVGHRRLLRGTYLAWTAAYLALAVTDSIAVVVLAQAVFGVGMGLAIPSRTVLLENAAPEGMRGRVMALSATAIFLGQFLSPLLLGPIVNAVTTTSGFVVAALFAGGVLITQFVPTLSPSSRYLL